MDLFVNRHPYQFHCCVGLVHFNPECSCLTVTLHPTIACVALPFQRDSCNVMFNSNIYGVLRLFSVDRGILSCET